MNRTNSETDPFEVKIGHYHSVVSRPAIVWVCLFSLGCATPRVRIEVTLPAINSNVNTRVEAYTRHTSIGIDRISPTHSLELGTGDIVAHPADLLPIVESDDLNRSAAEFTRLEVRNKRITLASIILTTIGTIVLLAGVVRELRDSDTRNAAFTAVGLSTILVGLGTLGFSQRRQLNSQLEAAANHYDVALRQRLGIDPSKMTKAERDSLLRTLRVVGAPIRALYWLLSPKK